jgi:hypothetical protein
LASNEVELTSQFKKFFPRFSNPNEFDLKLFFNQFDDSQNILKSIKAAVDGEASVNFQNIYNSSIAKYFDLDCEILKGIDENKYLLIVLKDFTQRKLIENERENYLLTLNNYIKAIDDAAIVTVTDEKGIILNVNNIVIEPNTKIINGYALSNLKSVLEIEIPGSVKIIGKFAFSGNNSYVAVANGTSSSQRFTLLNNSSGTLSLATTYAAANFTANNGVDFSSDNDYIVFSGSGSVVTLLNHTAGSVSLNATYNYSGVGGRDVRFS